MRVELPSISSICMLNILLNTVSFPFYIYVFNNTALTMFNLLCINCLAPSDVLIDLGLRMFVGSHDIPKDIEKASELFLGAD